MKKDTWVMVWVRWIIKQHKKVLEYEARACPAPLLSGFIFVILCLLSMTSDALNFDEKDIERNKVFAAFAYLWAFFLIPLFLCRHSKFARAHAKQGLVLFIVEALSSLVLWIPIFGAVWNLLVFFVVPIVSIVRALNGKYWAIPILSKFAEQINFD